jgi:transcriptional regulator with XRE-family HTH domain
MMKLEEWLLNHYRNWERQTGRKQSGSEFARWIGVKQPTLNRWMNGDSIPAADNLRRLARKLGPDIYQVVGQEIPDDLFPDALAGLTPSLRGRLESAIAETREAYHARKIITDSPEADRIAMEIFGKHGLIYKSTSISDSESPK